VTAKRKQAAHLRGLKRAEASMDDRTVISEASACRRPLLLCEIGVDKPDKLQNIVREIFWVGANYAIYCSDKGVDVQFSDDPEEQKQQRKKFTEICPELCELRYLTSQMRSRFRIPFFSPLLRKPGDTLFEHNLAQAVMLILEDNLEEGKQIAQKALAMAVRRVTIDNTIRYVRSSLIFGVSFMVVGAIALLFHARLGATGSAYLVAGMFGATGAVLSIATRLEAFQLQPCDESKMNYWMSAARVGMGVISAITLLLLANTIFDEPFHKLYPSIEWTSWQSAAMLGLIGGFAERLIPNLLQQTAGKMGPTVGTPVQAVRSAREVKRTVRSEKPAASA
jgi:hypothetical protein